MAEVSLYDFSKPRFPAIFSTIQLQIWIDMSQDESQRFGNEDDRFWQTLYYTIIASSPALAVFTDMVWRDFRSDVLKTDKGDGVRVVLDRKKKRNTSS